MQISKVKFPAIWFFWAAFIGVVCFGNYQSFHTLSITNQQRELLMERYGKAIALINDLRYLNASENESALRLVLTGDKSYLEAVRQNRADFLRRIEYLKVADSSPEVLEALKNILAIKSEMDELTTGTLVQRANGKPALDTHQKLERIGSEHSKQIIANLNLLFSTELDRFEGAKHHIEELISRLTKQLMLSSLLVLCSLLAGTILLLKLQNRNFKKVRRLELVASARKEVLETVAHDLKNPLCAIKLSCETANLIADKKKQDRCDFIDTIATAASSMESLIADLLDHVKIETGKIQLKKEVQDLREFMNRLFVTQAVTAKAKGIRLELQEGTGPLQASFDADRMQQVLTNLISNAVKFSPANSKISVDVKRAPTAVTISVADEGPGIEASKLKHIFDRYWQDENTASLGTGLGLSISQKIVEAHEGKIWVESQAGRGSTFSVSLPL